MEELTGEVNGCLSTSAECLATTTTAEPASQATTTGCPVDPADKDVGESSKCDEVVDGGSGGGRAEGVGETVVVPLEETTDVLLVAEEPKIEDRDNALEVSQLTVNVNTEHLKEIFDVYGGIKNIHLSPTAARGSHKAFVEFNDRKLAEEAKRHLDNGQLDGRPIRVRFMGEPFDPLPPTPPAASAARFGAASGGPRRELEGWNSSGGMGRRIGISGGQHGPQQWATGGAGKLAGAQLHRAHLMEGPVAGRGGEDSGRGRRGIEDGAAGRSGGGGRLNGITSSSNRQHNYVGDNNNHRRRGSRSPSHPRHDKTTRVVDRPTNTRRFTGYRPFSPSPSKRHRQPSPPRGRRQGMNRSPSRSRHRSRSLRRRGPNVGAAGVPRVTSRGASPSRRHSRLSPPRSSRHADVSSRGQQPQHFASRQAPPPPRLPRSPIRRSPEVSAPSRKRRRSASTSSYSPPAHRGGTVGHRGSAKKPAAAGGRERGGTTGRRRISPGGNRKGKQHSDSQEQPSRKRSISRGERPGRKQTSRSPSSSESRSRSPSKSSRSSRSRTSRSSSSTSSRGSSR
eukprot:GHVS01092017.1.p1 GENE.GHVS01092017.1~~GHVS01092017.1.p1  ORF type:complete len:565 (-),score=128.47 GHVS01092017.1:133-1827(-)